MILGIWDYYYTKTFPTLVDYLNVILAIWDYYYLKKKNSNHGGLFGSDFSLLAWLINTEKNFFISTFLVNNVSKNISISLRLVVPIIKEIIKITRYVSWWRFYNYFLRTSLIEFCRYVSAMMSILLYPEGIITITSTISLNLAGVFGRALIMAIKSTRYTITFSFRE